MISPIDKNDNKNSYNKNCILIEWNIFYITKGNKEIVFVSVYSLVGFSHDFKVYRIKTKLCKNTGKDCRNTHESMKNSGCKSGQHTCCSGSNHRYEHAVSAHQHHDTDCTSGAHSTVNSKVGDIQNTESKIDTNCHNTPDKTLGRSTWKCIY